MIGQVDVVQDNVPGVRGVVRGDIVQKGYGATGAAAAVQPEYREEQRVGQDDCSGATGLSQSAPAPADAPQYFRKSRRDMVIKESSLWLFVALLETKGLLNRPNPPSSPSLGVRQGKNG
jgi:hypothetical protein